jgi:hypothetical protein
MPFFGVPIRNGLPIGLGSVAGFGVQQFDPSQLFEGGTVAGAWYDPSDLTTMFTTSDGTTPVTMPGQGTPVSVGLMLDKSQGLVLGSELVTNGDFSNGTTGWTAFNAIISNVSNTLKVDDSASAGSNSSAVQQLSLTSLKWYKLTFTVVTTDANGWSLSLSPNATTTTAAQPLVSGTTTGTKTVYFLASTNNYLYVSVNGTGISYFDNISVRELPGNHAIAFNNTTARPELRARVNLLTYSEEFNNGVWVTLNTAVTANTTIAPTGTISADTLTASAGNAEHYIRQDIAASSGARTFSIYIKAGSHSFVQLIHTSSSGYYVNFNVSTGVVGAAGTRSAGSIEPVGNGWFRCVAVFDGTAAYGAGIRVYIIGNNTATYAEIYNALGTETVYIWGADLRPANIGANIPAYQRIADANTYDTNGFPLYLRFDGIDDGMYTPANLNLSATDKVGVFAGVRKLSDATIGTITELSSNASTTNGTFQLRGPATNGAQNYYATVSGTSVAEYLPATFAAPISNVVSSIMDIAGASISTELIPRVNGIVEQDSPSGSAGTGNFGTYPLYIGSRNNSTFWLNGHLYSLAVVGSAVSAGNIAAMENWVAGKTGIQI